MQDSKFDTYVGPEDTKEVLDQLDIYKAKVDEVRNNVNSFEKFKDTLDSVKEIPENIEEICDLYDNKYKLWKTKLAFEKLAEELSPLDIKTFEINKVKYVETVEKLMQDCMKAKGVLPDDNLCASET